jgi:hypothetical protein
MVVYLDAVSRRQLHRKMPETVSFLEEIYAGKWHNNVSSVFQFFNYHAIGSITKLNMRGMCVAGFSYTLHHRHRG